jgi:DNA-binding CsgD family transcriptional regulator
VLEQQNLLEELLLVRSLADLFAAMLRHVRQIGFDNFFYGAQIGTAGGVGMPFVYQGSLKKWCGRYIEKSYDQIDPLVTYASRRHVPMFWDDRYYRLSNAERLFQDGLAHGLGCGLISPMHGAKFKVAFVNLVSKSSEHEYELASHETLGRAQILACYFHEAFQKLENLIELDVLGARSLSNREIECLRWSADGKTSWEIAKILALSERTIVFHLGNAAEKLGAVNRRQAVVRAIALGLIIP